MTDNFKGLTQPKDLRNVRIQEKVTRGTLVTITGPSGSGKTTVAQLLSTLRGDFCEAVSHTTRDPREGEVPGLAYHFVTKKAFLELHEHGRFLESICYNGTDYGISSKEISDKVATGKHTILVVEPVGADQIRKRYHGKLVQIFIDACPRRLLQYMLARGDSPESAVKRIGLDETAIRPDSQTWDATIINDSSITSLCKKVMDLAHK